MASDIDMNFLAAIDPGMEIDGFRIIDRLHAGGTAHIFRVEPVTGPGPFPMIMKMPKIGRDQPTESVIGFETEAMILPALHGPNFPRFVAAGDIAKVPHLTMEWVKGTGLAEIVKKSPATTEETARIGAALADAVYALHQQNCIHHDLKPDNIIVRDDGIVVLIDFGFAHHDHFPDLLAEEKHFAAGSAPYVSPEQLTGSRQDSRSDIFALGVVIYELATARLPFGVPESLTQMKHRLWAAPTPPRARNADFPLWLQEIIMRCIEPDPVVRYQTASHVAFDLRHPEQVQLTARAQLTERSGFFKQFKLWWRSRDDIRAKTRQPPMLMSQSPVIMVAVDTSHPDDERHPALQWAVRQIASLNLEFRMVCISAIRAASIGEGGGAADTASGLQLVHKARLRNWIEPLGLPPHRLSLHVIESNDPAATLLEFAKSNNVDMIVLGAPAPSDTALAWWRSAASTVTANAHCTVHVVRVPTRPRSDWMESIDPNEFGGA